VNVFSESVQSRARQAEATRQRVLASAEEAFRRGGYEAATIRQIAATAGVSVGTVISVGDKDALLLAVFDGWIEAVHASRMASDEKTEPNPSQEILQLVTPFLNHFAHDWSLARQYAAIIVRGAHETPIFRGLASTLVAEIAAVLQRAGWTEAGSHRAADAIYLSYLGLLMTASNGAINEIDVIARLSDVIETVTSSKGSSQ